MKDSKIFFTKVNTFLEIFNNNHLNFNVKINDQSKIISNIQDYIENNELNNSFDFKIAKIFLGKGKPILKFNDIKIKLEDFF